MNVLKSGVTQIYKTMLTEYQKELIRSLTYDDPIMISLSKGFGKMINMTRAELDNCNEWYYHEWNRLKRELHFINKALKDTCQLEPQEHTSQYGMYRASLKRKRKKIHADFAIIKKTRKIIRDRLSNTL